MKTLLAFPLLLVCALSLAACSHRTPPKPGGATAAVKPSGAAVPEKTTASSKLTSASASIITPGVLKAMVNLGRLRIEKSFGTRVPGLDGFLIKRNGQYAVFFGTHGYLIAGAVVSPTGENLAAIYKAKYAPKPDYATLVKRLAADPSVITTGTGGPVIYAFEDPNCIFCHKFEKAATPLVKAGKLTVKVVLVSFLKADSAARAAAIMTAKNPVKALRENTAAYDTANEEGGYPAPAEAPPAQLAVLKAHLDWMQQAGSSGTPTLIYRGKDGKWTLASGFPGAAWLKQIATDGTKHG